MLKFKILGIVLIFFFLIGIKTSYQEIQVKKEGKLVSVVVADKHNGGGRSTSRFLDFQFHNKQYDVKVSESDYQNIGVGQTIQVLHKNGVEIFVMPYSNVWIEFVIGILCFLVGVFFMFYKPKKKVFS
ncbi:MAG: hypothetical protein CFE21_13940 [Bacteroidetes bacterium B1(2017)]|nr:MAG: hypothetical protein CFE21_13940 [Bacteroidetes bacterium B1(2017)]